MNVFFFKKLEGFAACTPTAINKKAQKGESKFKVISKIVQLPKKR
jgi:hypothetical protein